MKRSITKAAILALTLAPAAVAAAHPGHGATEATSLWHYVTEPVHVFVALAVLASAVAWIPMMRRRRRQPSADRS